MPSLSPKGRTGTSALPRRVLIPIRSEAPRAALRVPFRIIRSVGLCAALWAAGAAHAPSQARPDASEPPATIEGRALLVKGAASLRGLPFFPPNAIAALGGEYVLPPSARDGADGQGILRVQIWFTRERLFFGAPWRRLDFQPYAAYGLDRAKPGDFVLVLSTDAYRVFFSFPADRKRYRDLAAAIERRFEVFYANARDDAELSFPAYVDLPASAR